MRVAVRPILLSVCLTALLGPGLAAAQPSQNLPLQAQQPARKAEAGKPEAAARKPEPKKHEAPPKRMETPKPASAPGAAPSPGPEAVLPLPLPPVPPKSAAAPTTPPPAAAKPAEAEKPPVEEEKLPRFASLRSDDVNMRVGPGMRYPIQWVYKRRDMPVEITRQFDVWRYVRDADGVQGWMQGATLMGRRSFIVQKVDATLRSDPRDDASPVAELKVGVIGRIRSCEAASDWCQVQVSSYRGYLRREQFYGTFPHEAINP